MHNLQEHPGSVLDAPAIPILAMIEERREILAQQEAVGSMDFDAIKSGLLGSRRGFTENDQRPLFLCSVVICFPSRAGSSVQHGWPQRVLPRVFRIGENPSMKQLGDDSATRLVDGLGHRCETGEKGITMDARLSRNV